MAPPIVPRATYRLQFHKDFGFDDARAIVPYLAALGVSHLYASPLTMARPGSNHGYDVIDFNRLNPELGDEAAFDALIAELHAHDMGLLLDFVPNHMGVGSDNPWWLDVLEWGPLSPFATFFDIDWEASARGVPGKVTLPVLGDQYGKVLEAGELRLQFDAVLGTFHIAYHAERFPIAVRRYPQLLHATANLLDRSGGPLFELADRFAALFAEDAGPAQWAVRRQEAFALKAALAEAARDPAVRAALDAAVAAQNGTPGLPESFQALHELLEDQAYRLAYWRVASSEINYRRFFDINQLAGLRVEQGDVFEATHRLLLRLIGEGKVQGVRLDHIDGLYDPRGYCQRLLSRAADVLAEGGNGERPAIDARQGRPIYLVVEKILARHESLRDDLPVAGTTGYEFMNLVNGLFVDPAAARSLTATYHRFIDQELAFDQVVLAAKQQILRYYLNSELHVLGHEFYRLAQQSWLTRDFTLTGLREALADIITRFPVYRTYITEDGARPEDRRDLDWAVSRARRETALVDHTVFDFLHAALSTDLVGTRGYERAEVIATAMHFQQLTGPVMAKSVEDTAFYRYHRLVSLNEVGGEPDHVGVSPSAFHHLLQQQQRRHPCSMLASATHDHKRGEDVRARIDALSELPLEWRRQVRRWARLNRLKRRELDGQRVPGRNDEYLLYQTLRRRLAVRARRGGSPRARRVHRAHRRLHAEGDARGQAPLQLGGAGPGVRGGPGALRPAHPRSTGRAGVSGGSARVSAPYRGDRRAQRARPDPVEAHGAGRARHLSGLRAVGPQPGRSGQPPPGRFRAQAPVPAADRGFGRAARQLAGRPHQAARHRTHARAAAPPARSVRDRELRAARGLGQPERSRGRLRPPERAGIDGRGRAAPGRRLAPGSGAALPCPGRLGRHARHAAARARGPAPHEPSDRPADADFVGRARSRRRSG